MKRKNHRKKKKVRPNKVTRKPYVRLTKEQYYNALKDPRWQKKRLRVFERDGWKCRKCGSTRTTLHVHHLKYTRKYPWNEPIKHLITRCERCHIK